MIRLFTPVLAGITLFVVLYVAVDMHLIFSLDETVAHWAISYRQEELTPLVLFLTNFYAPSATIAFVAAVVIMLLIVRRYKEALYFMVTLFGVLFVKGYLKGLMMRPRPPYKMIDIGGYSFPSGHATLAMASAVGLYIIARSIRGDHALSYLLLVVVSLWAGIIGFTRLYLGVHWFSDIVAGWAVGFTWAYLMALIFLPQKRLKNKF